METSNKARFHVVVRTQTNKSVLYFTVRRNVKFGVPNANPCTKSDVKSGLRTETPEISIAKVLKFISLGFRCSMVYK